MKRESVPSASKSLILCPNGQKSIWERSQILIPISRYFPFFLCHAWYVVVSLGIYGNLTSSWQEDESVYL